MSHAKPDNLNLPGWVCSHFDAKEIYTTCGGQISDPNTRFPWASVTKTFTSHLCLQPSFRDKLDVPISEILPAFRLADPEATRNLTPRDALCHFSGLAPHTQDWVRCELSREDYIRERLPLLPSEGPFREKHRYSNLMYAVLGQWLEVLDGRSWEDQVTEDILLPLEMKKSGHIDDSWTQKCAPPHAISSSGKLESIPPFFARRNHLIAPASELMGSMPDLARWGQYLLSLPKTDERWQAHSCIRQYPRLDYGLGWRLDHIHGEPRCWHSGQCSGYTSLLILYPDQKTGSALATNRSDAVPLLQNLAPLRK